MQSFEHQQEFPFKSMKALKHISFALKFFSNRIDQARIIDFSSLASYFYKDFFFSVIKTAEELQRETPLLFTAPKFSLLWQVMRPEDGNKHLSQPLFLLPYDLVTCTSKHAVSIFLPHLMSVGPLTT